MGCLLQWCEVIRFAIKNNEEQLFLTAKYAKIAKGGDDFIEINEEQLLGCRWQLAVSSEQVQVSSVL